MGTNLEGGIVKCQLGKFRYFLPRNDFLGHFGSERRFYKLILSVFGSIILPESWNNMKRLERRDEPERGNLSDFWF